MVLEIGRRIRSNRGELLQKTVQDYCDSRAGDPQNSIIIYNNGNVNLSVRVSPEEDTVWLTQSQIAELFQTSQQDVSHHVRAIHKEYLYMPLAEREYETAYYNIEIYISNILGSGELEKASVHKDSLYTAQDGKGYLTSFYNLEIHISNILESGELEEETICKKSLHMTIYKKSLHMPQEGREYETAGKGVTVYRPPFSFLVLFYAERRFSLNS